MVPSGKNQLKEGEQMAEVGNVAPDFKVRAFVNGNEEEVSLSQYRGKKHVVLAFHVLDFTGG